MGPPGSAECGPRRAGPSAAVGGLILTSSCSSLRVQRRDPRLLGLQGWDTAGCQSPRGVSLALLLPSVCGFLWNRVPFLCCFSWVSSHLIDLCMHINMRVCVCVCTYTYIFVSLSALVYYRVGSRLVRAGQVFLDHLLCMRVFTSSGPPVRRAGSLFSSAARRLCCGPGGQLFLPWAQLSCVLEPTYN